MELQTSRGGSEGPEGDGEVHEGVRFVADGHNSRLGVGYTAGVKLLSAHGVDHMGLRVKRSRARHWADQVDLVVLLHIHDVVGVVNPEHWALTIPMHVVDFFGLTCAGHGDCCQKYKTGDAELRHDDVVA